MIVRVRNAKALTAPEMPEFIARAFSAFPEAIPLLPGWVVSEKRGIFLTVSEGLPRGIAMVSLPSGIGLDTQPEVLHLYNEGPQSGRRELVEVVVDFIHNSGYNRFRAINFSGMPDATWTRIFKPEGWRIKPVGTIMEFER